jgi:hypothetical protein
MLQLLGTGILPADFWVWYFQRAGRSKLTSSFATYVAAYIPAYGNRLPYLRDAGRAMATVTFVQSMLSWYVSVGGYVWYVRLSAAWQKLVGMLCCSFWTILCCMVCDVGFWVMLSECDVLLPVCSCCRSPATANKDVCSQLSEAQQAALKKAVEMGQQFAANPTSPNNNMFPFMP